MNVAVIMPCFNEERFAGEVISRAKKYASLVVACDDASTDHTGEVAREAGAYVAKNYAIVHGAGNNTIQGFNHLKYPLLYKAIVTLDGDGQHDPDEIPKLIQPILDGEADVVIGSRFLGDISSMPKYRRWGIRLINLIYNLGKSHITDTQCCFRAFRPEFLQKLKVRETGFAFSVEMLVKLRALGCRFREVPVRTIYHAEFGANSTLNPLKHGLQVAFKTLYWRLKVEVFKNA